MLESKAILSTAQRQELANVINTLANILAKQQEIWRQAILIDSARQSLQKIVKEIGE